MASCGSTYDAILAAKSEKFGDRSVASRRACGAHAYYRTKPIMQKMQFGIRNSEFSEFSPFYM